MRLLMLSAATTTGVRVEVVCSTHQPEAKTGVTITRSGGISPADTLLSMAITTACEYGRDNIDLRDFKKNSEPFYAGVSQRKRGQKQKRK